MAPSLVLRDAAREVAGAGGPGGDGDRQSPLSPRFTPSFPSMRPPARQNISGDEREGAKGRETLGYGVSESEAAAAAAAAEGKKL